MPFRNTSSESDREDFVKKKFLPYTPEKKARQRIVEEAERKRKKRAARTYDKEVIVERDVGGAEIEPIPIKGDEERQAYEQRLYKEWERLDTARDMYRGAADTFRGGWTYYIRDPDTGLPKPVPGWILKSTYGIGSERLTEPKQILRTEYERAKRLPPGTTFGKDKKEKEPGFFSQTVGFLTGHPGIESMKYQLIGDLPGGETVDYEYYWKKHRKTVERHGSLIESYWKKGDILGGVGYFASAPVLMPLYGYGIGKGIGFFASTKLGGKPLFDIGIGYKGYGVIHAAKTLPKSDYMLSGTVTPTGLAQTGMAGVFGYKTIGSGVKAYKEGELGSWAGMLAVTLPLVYYPYKWGYRSGMGWGQRRGAMSGLKGADRVRQQAVYDMTDAAYKMKPVSYQQKPFNLADIQRFDTHSASLVSQHLRTVRGQWFTRMGGSSSTYAQMPSGSFRTGNIPSNLYSYISRGTSRSLIGTSMPGDFDASVYNIFGSYKQASLLGKSHVVDVHMYKPGGYLWGGKTVLPSSKIYVSGVGDIKGLSLPEQFIRKSFSSMPSSIKGTGYRWYKDVPDMYELGDVLNLQSGGKLSGAMDRFVHPGSYPVPRISFGERFIKLFGGAKEPTWVETYGGQFVEPVYPSSMSPQGYVPLSMPGGFLGGYPTSSYSPSVVSPSLSYNTPSFIKPYAPSKTIKKGYPSVLLTPSLPPIRSGLSTIRTSRYPGVPSPVIPSYPTSPYTPSFDYSPSPPYTPIPSFPKSSFKLPSGGVFRYKPSRAVSKIIDFGYHERTWKVPRMEDFLKGW